MRTQNLEPKWPRKACVLVPCHLAPRFAPRLLCAGHLPPAPALLGLGCGPPVMWVCVHTGLPPTTTGPAAAEHREKECIGIKIALKTHNKS